MFCSRLDPSITMHRGFFVIDALSPGSLVWARKALVHLGGLLALSLRKPPPLGVAVLQRRGDKQSAQLQILLRPGRCFQLKEYVSCIARVTAASPEDAADGKTLGITIKALVEHLLTLPSGEGCSNHLFILSSGFAAHTTLQRVLQLVCSNRVGAFLHFLQLSGPETDVSSDQAAADASTLAQQQQRDAFLQCLSGLEERATFEEFTADCEAVTDLLCHSWLRQLSTTGGSNAASSNPRLPDVLLQLGPDQAVLPCKLQQHLLQLHPWLLPAQLCPCHQLPMQPPTGSATAALAAQSAASDVATAAALLALPEDHAWCCSITAQPVLQALSCCADASVLQLGRHTQLKAAAHSSAAQAATSAGLTCVLALPLGQPCELMVQHAVGLVQVDSSMVYGMPLVLVPAASQPRAVSAAAGAAAAADTAAAGPGSAREAEASQDAAMLMKALCQLLLEREQVLLLVSSHDVVRRCTQPLKQWYVAQPAGDGASLLLRSIACREQLLPPAGLLQRLDEGRVVLLDSEHLETVRGCLQALPGLSCTSGFQSSSSVEPSATVAGGTAGCGMQESSSNAGEEGEPLVPLPLLLSCGLHDWVARVLSQTSGTYTPPASAPLTGAQAAPPAWQQQHAAAVAADAQAADTDAQAASGSIQQPQLLRQAAPGTGGGSNSVAAGIAAAAFGSAAAGLPAGKAAAGAGPASKHAAGPGGAGSGGGSRSRAAGKEAGGKAAQQAAASAAGTAGGRAGRSALRLSSRRSAS